MSQIDEKLEELALSLPEVSLPAANYVPTMRSGHQLVISGQLPMQNGAPQFVGKVGQDISLEDAQKCAELCALNVLAQAKAALGGSFDSLAKLIRLGVFVNATEDFTDHPKVANGASDLMVAVMGDAGKHARAAVGVSGLPLGVAVEVEATFEIR